MVKESRVGSVSTIARPCHPRAPELPDRTMLTDTQVIGRRKYSDQVQLVLVSCFDARVPFG